MGLDVAHWAVKAGLGPLPLAGPADNAWLPLDPRAVPPSNGGALLWDWHGHLILYLPRDGSNWVVIDSLEPSPCLSPAWDVYPPAMGRAWVSTASFTGTLPTRTAPGPIRAWHRHPTNLTRQEWIRDDQLPRACDRQTAGFGPCLHCGEHRLLHSHAVARPGAMCVTRPRLREPGASDSCRCLFCQSSGAEEPTPAFRLCKLSPAHLPGRALTESPTFPWLGEEEGDTFPCEWRQPEVSFEEVAARLPVSAILAATGPPCLMLCFQDTSSPLRGQPASGPSNSGLWHRIPMVLPPAWERCGPFLLIYVAEALCLLRGAIAGLMPLQEQVPTLQELRDEQSATAALMSRPVETLLSSVGGDGPAWLALLPILPAPAAAP